MANAGPKGPEQQKIGYDPNVATDVPHRDVPPKEKPKTLPGKQEPSRIGYDPKSISDIDYRDVPPEKKELKQLSAPEKRKPKAHFTLSKPGTPTQKPIARYKGLREDIEDIQGEELSEKDIEDVFGLLLGHQSMDEPGQEKAGPEKPQATNKEQDLEKIKSTIKDVMTPEQRRMLWDLLNKSGITEEIVSQDDAKNILKAASYYSKFRSLKKEKAQIDDLQQAWKEIGYSLDTQDIGVMLQRKFGFSDRAIERVFSDVLNPHETSKDIEYGQPSERSEIAIKNVAEYAIKHGLADELKAYLQAEFSKDIQPRGFFGRMADKLKKKFTNEEVKEVFLKILEEERELKDPLLKRYEIISLGRNKK